MNPEKLKPCPFCGGKAAMWDSGSMHPGYKTYRVCCLKCHVAQADQMHYSQREAADAWNRRADDGCEE